MAQPLVFSVDAPSRQARIHVLIRLLLLVALGALGVSSLYWVLYLALPALVALVITQRGGARYLAEQGGPIVRTLRWLAGAYAYLWMMTDALPETDPRGPVHLELAPAGAPTVGGALLKLLTSIPALVVLALLSFLGGFLWVVAAIVLLITGHAPPALTSYFEMMLRYQFRLVAYHLSLTPLYPSFDTTPHDVPTSLPQAG